MNEQNLSFVQTLLGILPFLIAMGAYLAYLYGRAYRSRTLEEMSWLRSELRRISHDYQQLQEKTAGLSSEDPAPFGLLATELFDTSSQLEMSIRGNYHRYDALHQESNELNAQGFWLLPRAIAGWYRVRRGVTDLYVNLEETQGQLDKVKEIKIRIDQLGWEVAYQSRSLLEKLQYSLRDLQSLREGMGGDEFERIASTAEQLQNKLASQIPVLFFTDDQQVIINQADKGSITQVYRVIEGSQSEIEGISKTVEEWKVQYENLVDILHETQERYHQVLSEIQILETLDQFPVRCDQGRYLLKELQGKAESILPEGHISTPNQISRALKRGKKIVFHLKNLEETSQKIRTQHQEVVSLITKPEIQQGGDWIRGAFDLLNQVKKYDPVNWPSTNPVSSFKDGLDKLSDYQTKVPIDDINTTISEAEIPEMAVAVKELFTLHQALRAQLVGIQKRLVEIQTTERTVKEPILRARALLQQMTSLVSANSLLKRIVGLENAKLSESLEQIVGELDHPEKGIMEKKAQKASALLRRTEQSFRKWSGALEKDLFERMKELASQVGILQEILILDDPVFNEIHDLHVKYEQLVRPQPSPGKRSDVPLLQVVNDIKNMNEVWQHCISLVNRLDEIAGPILERYKKAEKNRENALVKLDKANQLIPEELGWPPTTQRLSNERLLMGTLEKRWIRLKQERQKTLQVVSELSELSEQYLGLATRTGQSIQAAEQEQSRIKDYEQRLEESRRLWRHQIAEHKDKANVTGGIESMLTELDQDVEAVKNKYQRGIIQYAQVLQSMRSVCRKVDEALISVDTNLVLDINGVIQKRIY